MSGGGTRLLSVALLYVAAILGAGFASGREIWQFFGVFGKNGYIGLCLAGFLFMAIGFMTSSIARRLGTNDMGRVIVPGGHPGLVSFVGWFMALILFTVLVTLSAAGGALFHQQFGVPKPLGGAFIIFLVTVTVIGGFERMSRVFRMIMPTLGSVVFLSCGAILLFGERAPGGEGIPSPLAGTWYLAAVLYISYNALAVIPIVATAAVHARSNRDATLGAVLGGLILSCLAMMLLSALLTNKGLSQAMEMPMLALSGFSPLLGPLYLLVLFCAVYSSATSNYYGLTTKLAEPHRRMKIILIALMGYACGLVGFSNIVNYMFPVEGFLGIIIVGMLTINFIHVMRRSVKR